MENVTQEEISDFIKTVVEIGGIYKVDDQWFICTAKDNQRIEVNIGSQKKPDMQPVKIFHSGMHQQENAVILNPFAEPLGNVQAQMQWFWSSRATVVSCITYSTMIELFKLAQQGVEEVSVGLSTVLSHFTDTVDEKMLDNLKEIQGDDLMTLVYDTRKKTAYLRTRIYDDEFRSTHKKLRKKDWRAMEAFLEYINLNDLSPFQFKSASVGYMEAEARLNVLAMWAEAINPITKLVLDRDLQPDDITCGLEKIKEYRRMSKWFQSHKSRKAQEATSQNAQQASQPPWRSGSLPSQGSGVPASGAPVARSSLPAGNFPGQQQQTVAPQQAQPVQQPPPQQQYYAQQPQQGMMPMQQPAPQGYGGYGYPMPNPPMQPQQGPPPGGQMPYYGQQQPAMMQPAQNPMQMRPQMPNSPLGGQQRPPAPQQGITQF